MIHWCLYILQLWTFFSFFFGNRYIWQITSITHSGAHHWGFLVITDRNEVVAKVMFLQLCVILFTGDGFLQRRPMNTPPPIRRPPKKEAPPPNKETPCQGDPRQEWDPPNKETPYKGGTPRRPAKKEAPPNKETPPRRRPPNKETPSPKEGDPSLPRRPPLPQEWDPPIRRPPAKEAPPHTQEADSGIRYASYWNAFLF